ncbi:MAG: CarD family transcriptional regulator [Hyphomicrobiales bacterium]|nr:CarD family transcriptional regulator [Hyphomicrobiales bacterium]
MVQKKKITAKPAAGKSSQTHKKPAAAKTVKPVAKAAPKVEAKKAAAPAAARPAAAKPVAAAKPAAKGVVPAQAKAAPKADTPKVEVAKAPVAAKPVAAKPAAQAPAAKPAAKPAAAQPAKPAAAPAAAQPNLKPQVAAFQAARASQAQAQQARAIPAGAANPVGPKITGPDTAPPAAATPKDLAQKAAQVHKALAEAPKRPVSQRHGFKTSEWIVYPAHGVGRIVAIEEEEIAGIALELFVIQFEKDKMTLRVPTGKSASVGMRKLADEGIVKRAMETLKGKARIKRTMWSRRAQEFEAKINSGDLISIAEVVRDLYRAENQPEQSYSERQLYEAALDRMAREIAAVDKLDERGAVQRITEVLSKSAKVRRAAAEEAGASAAEAEIKAA